MRERADYERKVRTIESAEPLRIQAVAANTVGALDQAATIWCNTAGRALRAGVGLEELAAAWPGPIS